MAGNEAVWAKVHGAFDPGEVLVGARSREIYCEREHSPFELIRKELDPALKPSRPPIVFFTGHRGSGKSSMLWRLLDRFKRDYFVVYFDIEHNLDSRTANQIDLLYLIGAFTPTFSGKILLLRRLGLVPRRPVIVAPRGEMSAAALKIKRVKKRLFLWAARFLGLYREVVWHASSPIEVADIRREMGPAATVRIAGEATMAFPLKTPRKKTRHPTKIRKIPAKTSCSTEVEKSMGLGVLWKAGNRSAFLAS